MKRLLAISMVASLGIPAPGGARADEIGQAIATAYAKVDGALAMVEFDLKGELGETTLLKLGICISDKGTLMISTLDPLTPLDTIQEIRAIVPGPHRKPLKAELIGVDRVSGLTFVRVTEAHKWSVVQFASRADLKPGMAVFSVGLMGKNLGHTPYVGTAYVSAVLRTPESMGLVTGGTLTLPGSPVFNARGLAIGLVRSQLLQTFQVIGSNGRPTSVQMAGQDQTVFFAPSEVFVAGIRGLPALKPDKPIRRMPWIGVINFQPMSEAMAREYSGLNEPVAVVGKVIPGTPADKAKIVKGMFVMGLNGKPLERLASPEMTVRNFVRKLVEMPAGTHLTLTVVASLGAEKKTIPLVTEPWPLRPAEAKQFYSKELGMVLREKVPLDEHIDDGGTAMDSGLYTVGVIRGAPASRTTLRKGDLVQSIGGAPVRTVQDVRNAIGKLLSARKDIAMAVKKGSISRTVRIKPPPPSN